MIGGSSFVEPPNYTAQPIQGTQQPLSKLSELGTVLYGTAHSPVAAAGANRTYCIRSLLIMAALHENGMEGLVKL